VLATDPAAAYKGGRRHGVVLRKWLSAQRLVADALPVVGGGESDDVGRERELETLLRRLPASRLTAAGHARRENRLTSPVRRRSIEPGARSAAVETAAPAV